VLAAKVLDLQTSNLNSLSPEEKLPGGLGNLHKVQQMNDTQKGASPPRWQCQAGLIIAADHIDLDKPRPPTQD
jgi:hypothetical protein